MPGWRKPVEAPMRELAAYRAAQPRGLPRELRELRCSPIFGWGANPQERPISEEEGEWSVRSPIRRRGAER